MGCEKQRLSRYVRMNSREVLARKTLARVGDYLSNLMCSKLIPEEEMQTYVRTNVRHHFDENLGLVSELARYAYEVHYLALANLPSSYFFNTSRFIDYFIKSGIISEETSTPCSTPRGACSRATRSTRRNSRLLLQQLVVERVALAEAALQYH